VPEGEELAAADADAGDERAVGHAQGLGRPAVVAEGGEGGDQPRRDLAAVGARQGRLADAERDRGRGVIGHPSADAPASGRHALEVDHHQVAGPLAVHRDDGIGQGSYQGHLKPAEPRLGHASGQVWHSRSLHLLPKML
jgi:hypothetical protein